MDAEGVQISRDGEVATITIDRPQRHNSFDVATIRALHAAVNHVVDDREIRGVVMTGAGRAFCTGADLQEMHAQRERAARHLDDLTLASHATVQAIRHAPKPFVAAVNGVAAGGGVGLALAADLVLMTSSARFVLAFANLGLSPDCGATAVLTRVLGAYRTREAILLDDGIPAQQALDWGLANRVVPDAELLPAARAAAARCGARSRHTLAATKRLVHLAQNSPVESSLEAEREAIIAGAATPDFAEGLEAFRAKRAPVFV